MITQSKTSADKCFATAVLKNSLVAYFVSFASFFIPVQATVAKNSKLAVVASGFDLNKNQAH